MMKKKLYYLVCAVLLVGLLPAWGLASSWIRVVVDGEELPLEPAPQVVEGRVLVPIRFVAEALGAEVHWEEATRTVQIDTAEIRMPYIAIDYLTPDTPVRFVEKPLGLLFLPHNEAPSQREILPNTLVEVNERVEVDGELWLKVTMPVYDTPMNMKGWVKEADTLPFTDELVHQVQSDVRIQAGTTIYNVWEFEEISEAVAEELTFDFRGRLTERADGYVKIFTPGGQEFWVAEKDVRFPRMADYLQ